MSASDDLWRAMYGLNKGKLSFRNRVRFWLNRLFPKYKIEKPIAKRRTPASIIPTDKRAELSAMWDSVTGGIDG